APRGRRADRTISASLAILATIAVLTACYAAKMVFVVLLIGILIAFILTPLVDLAERFRLPRPLGAFLVVLLMMGVIGGISYYSYSKATDFVRDLPKYSEKIRNVVNRVRQQAESFQKQTEKVLPK